MTPAPIVAALALCRQRLDLTERCLGLAERDADALLLLADVERALTALGVNVGLERRAAILRQRAHKDH